MSTRALRGGEPLLLPLSPVQGWRGAGTIQRLGAVGMVVLWVVLVWASRTRLEAGVGDALLIGALLVGPLCHWSAARILRPWPDAVGVERRMRHALAALGGAWGSYVLVLMAVPFTEAWEPVADSAALMVLGASLALLVGLPWALVALLVRALSDGGGRALAAARVEAAARDEQERVAPRALTAGGGEESR